MATHDMTDDELIDAAARSLIPALTSIADRVVELPAPADFRVRRLKQHHRRLQRLLQGLTVEAIDLINQIREAEAALDRLQRKAHP